MLQLSIKNPVSLSKVCRALSTPLRLSIFEQIQKEPTSVIDIASKLDCSVSTVASNIRVLEEAGLVNSQFKPAKNGSMKICYPVYFDIKISLHQSILPSDNMHKYVLNMPVGHYSDCDIYPSCGMYATNKQIGTDDDVSSFYLPNRTEAQLLWFRKGYVEYKFPNTVGKNVKSIEFEMEICSEAPGFNHKWPSDITLWINNIEVGTWTSPGDFGDRKGRLTPDSWTLGVTQYGLLKTWRVDKEGSYISKIPSSSVTIDDLNLNTTPYVSMKIGIKDNAENQGGINIFGMKFGDYEQDIRMTLYY